MYLRNFADDAGRLVMVDRNDLARRLPTTVEKACRETGFYSLPTESIAPEAQTGHDPEVVEKLLSRIEGNAAPIIESIVSGRGVPTGYSQERFDLSLFASLQLTRTWAFRRQLHEVADATANHFLRYELTDERVSKYLKARGKPAKASDIAAFRVRATGPGVPRSCSPTHT